MVKKRHSIIDNLPTPLQNGIRHAVKTALVVKDVLETFTDLNFHGLVEALEKKNWKVIKRSLKSAAVRKYITLGSNDILFAAIRDGQYAFADDLLALSAVRDHASLQDESFFMRALKEGIDHPEDFFDYVLRNIPSATQHVAENNNLVLVNAIDKKLWDVVGLLFKNENVTNEVKKHYPAFMSLLNNLTPSECSIIKYYSLAHIPEVYAILKTECNTALEFSDMCQVICTQAFQELSRTVKPYIASSCIIEDVTAEDIAQNNRAESVNTVASTEQQPVATQEPTVAESTAEIVTAGNPRVFRFKKTEPFKEQKLKTPENIDSLRFKSTKGLSLSSETDLPLQFFIP